MAESRSPQNKDRKDDTVVIKSMRIKRPKRVIQTKRTRPPVSEPVSYSTASLLPQQSTPESTSVPAKPLQPEIAPVGLNQQVTATMCQGATGTSRSRIDILDRICQPSIQYKLFLVFLSIWGVSFILFYLSTNFAIIIPDPFNPIVLGFFLASTSLTGLYTFLLGLQHLRSARQSADDSYYSTWSTYVN